jgi:hypothetical protein
MFIRSSIVTPLRVGQRVRIKRSIRSPVFFDDGVQFRYIQDELKALPDEFGIPAKAQFAS